MLDIVAVLDDGTTHILGQVDEAATDRIKRREARGAVEHGIWLDQDTYIPPHRIALVRLQPEGGDGEVAGGS